MSVSHAPEELFGDSFMKKSLSLDFFSFILSTVNLALYLAIARIFFVTRVSKFSDRIH